LIDPHVRRAAIDDAAVLGELEATARDEVGDVRGGARWLETHPPIGDGWLTAVRERTVFVAVIADSPPDGKGDDAVVGYLVADLVADPLPVARVDQVYVMADARDLGFGDALVAAVMDWGRGAGAELIEAETLPGDRNLKNLYERARVTARLITVSKRL
jgi:GNAT superfamily N-acetyltransferase